MNGMILTCPACTTRYEVDPAKFPPQGRDVRCAKCGEVWHAMGVDLPPEPVAPPPQPSYEPEPPRAETYAQPEPRDREPQQEQAFYEQSAADETPRVWPRRIGLMAGWIGLAALVLAIGIGGAIFRRQVVEAWPQTASLYSSLGWKVNATGLNIHDIKQIETPQDGQLVLTVSGALTNVTNRELPVPQIRVGLVDGDKREIYHWTFAPEVMTLRPGQTTRFVTRLSSPPEGARRLDIRFAKAGE
jgi:predicted Zn finger-like uncharacterized protein